MNYLSVHQLKYSVADQTLFSDITFGLSEGDRVAMVGPNGAGKSSFIRLLAGVEPPEAGQVVLNKDIRLGYFTQHVELPDEQTVLENLFSAENETLQTIRRYETVIRQLEKGENLEELQNELAQVNQQMESLDAWDYEARIRTILGKLGIHRLDQRIGSLSGGQKKRVSLAKVLIDEPDLLIMDEPTNHLDLEAIEWLEGYLSTRCKALLIVTHDRYFLDRVANQIIELEEGQLHTYKGNYSYYVQKRQERLDIEAANIEKAKNLYRKELEWMRREPKARGTKARHRVEAFGKLEQEAKKRINNEQVDINVLSQRQGSKVAEMHSIRKKLGGHTLIDHFTYHFKRREKIGIIGPNGIGKSTFLKVLTGEVPPDSGSVKYGETTVFGHYTQDDPVFPEDLRVIEIVQSVAEVVRMSNGNKITATQMLNRFLFPPKKQYQYAQLLSGGEKKRLNLLRVLMANPNFLILDEPTNDLDIPTLNVLEDYLLQFPGTVLLVSHDRYFMDRLVDHLFVFEGNGHISDFPGNYTDYREWRENQEKQNQDSKAAAKKAAAPTQDTPPATPKAQKKLSYKEKRELEQIEAEMEQLEARKQELVGLLQSGEQDGSKVAEWGQELDQLTKDLEAKENRWLELSERA